MGRKNNFRSSFDIGRFPRRIADPDVPSVAQTCPEEVRRLYEEVWNKRRLDVVDELISASHALNDPVTSGSQMGPDLYKRRVVELTTSFPDLRFTIEDMIAEKGKVGVSWTISGTHQGEFLDIPATDSKIVVKGFTTSQAERSLIRMLDGTLWACYDNSAALVDRGPLRKRMADPPHNSTVMANVNMSFLFAEGALKPVPIHGNCPEELWGSERSRI